ncbi:MAG: ATP-binding cassette domain-containing protein [Gemmobacter sp.]|nr:ATP-binding cassette domain-containing protein [Gemmobacter sp.]
MVFLGPSGCGKSTMLRMIAGLEEVTAGRITIGGTDVTHLHPGQRGVAMVFQSYALYPHMTVADNITFGLRRAGVAKAERSTGGCPMWRGCWVLIRCWTESPRATCRVGSNSASPWRGR